MTKLTLTSAGLIVGGALILGSMWQGKREATGTSRSAQALSPGRPASSPKVRARASGNEAGPRPGPAAAAMVPAMPSTGTLPAARGEFRFQKELDDYAFLRRKIFLSDDEKAEKARLLRDPSFVAGLESLFRDSLESGFEPEMRRNLALDLLFEALEGEGRDAASRVLRSVVRDERVESSALDSGTRRTLAGLKAEVLYQWSSKNPRVAREVGSWLPGPVSERIWRNVQAAQNQNLAESAIESGGPPRAPGSSR